jgi:hypothetical protein
MNFDPHAYGPDLAEVLAGDRNRELGPGRPVAALREKLSALRAEQALGDRSIADRNMAQLCIAGAWLVHDFLDESHTISQGVATSSGSYWHAIMHRREPDESNAKYWNRRVGEHPVYGPLCTAARELAQRSGAASGEAEFLATQSEWDPDRFVDLCSGARRGRNPHETLCRRIQQREWELLFDACFQGALEPSSSGEVSRRPG